MPKFLSIVSSWPGCMLILFVVTMLLVKYWCKRRGVSVRSAHIYGCAVLVILIVLWIREVVSRQSLEGFLSVWFVLIVGMMMILIFDLIRKHVRDTGYLLFVRVLTSFSRLCSSRAREDLDGIIHDLKCDARLLQEHGKSTCLFLLIEVCLAIFRTVISELASQPLMDELAAQSKPMTFVQPPRALVEEFDFKIESGRKLLLMGRGGSGKTTFAREICRRYLDMSDKSTPKQVPIYLSLSQVRRSDGLSWSLMNQISEKLPTQRWGSRRLAAKRRLKNGGLFVILDDLDYLDKAGLGDLSEFIRRAQKNSFFCLLSEAPQERFWEGFDRICMPYWGPSEVKAYIHQRIPDNTRATDLFVHLEEMGMLAKSLTPYEFTLIVDAYLEDRIFELFVGQEFKHGYRMQGQFVEILLRHSAIGYVDGIKELGRLSLRLLKLGRSSFAPEEVGLDSASLRSLIPKLLEERGDDLVFTHNNFQILLAGKYLGEFWPEAKAALRDTASKNLIWTAVYHCTRDFIREDHVSELHKAFQILSDRSE